MGQSILLPIVEENGLLFDTEILKVTYMPKDCRIVLEGKRRFYNAEEEIVGEQAYKKVLSNKEAVKRTMYKYSENEILENPKEENGVIDESFTLVEEIVEPARAYFDEWETLIGNLVETKIKE